MSRKILATEDNEAAGGRRAEERPGKGDEQESLQKFNKLFCRNPALMAVSEQENGTFTEVNDAFLTTIGYSREEVIGNTSAALGLFVDPEEQRKAVHQLRTTGKLVNCELKVRCKNGRVLDGIFSGEILECQGKKSFLTVMVDITERRNAEEKLKNSLHEKEILLHEIHHRVKNNLQTVSSLLSLKIAQIQEPRSREVLIQMKNRIKSMALVHEKLYTSRELAHVELDSLIRSMVQDLIIAYGSNDTMVEMEIEKVSVNLEKATPVSLILNELVSNALDHAFPVRGAGTLKIGLHKNAENEVVLSVGDNGKGLPDDFDFSRVTTLGLTLVKELVHQLDGSMELCRENGTTFRIKFQAHDTAPAPLAGA